MNRLMKWMLIGVLSILTVALPACNTIEGMGEDIESGGEEIEAAAD